MSAQAPERSQEEVLICGIGPAARFKNGHEGWMRFLDENIDSQVPINNGAPIGRYTVIVQFTIDSTGKVCCLKPLTKTGYGMEEEAIRVITKSPDWEAEMYNGVKVRSYSKQPVTFIVHGKTEKQD